MSYIRPKIHNCQAMDSARMQPLIGHAARICRPSTILEVLRHNQPLYTTVAAVALNTYLRYLVVNWSCSEASGTKYVIQSGHIPVCVSLVSPLTSVGICFATSNFPIVLSTSTGSIVCCDAGDTAILHLVSRLPVNLQIFGIKGMAEMVFCYCNPYPYPSHLTRWTIQRHLNDT